MESCDKGRELLQILLAGDGRKSISMWNMEAMKSVRDTNYKETAKHNHPGIFGMGSVTPTHAVWSSGQNF